MRIVRIIAAAVLSVTACATGSAVPIGPGPTLAPDTTPTIEVTEPETPLLGLIATPLAEGLPPLTQAIAPIGDDRIFLVEKAGRIQVMHEGEVLEDPFLDIETKVLSEGNEQGLLTLAFHPDFNENGRVFVVYTYGDGDVRLEGFRVSDDPDRLDHDSDQVVLEIPQPHQYHQSGSVVFGPEGYLWMSLGDGGGQEDQFENGQDPATLQGTIIRIDIDANDSYAIPPENPFVDEDINARPEVWAYGLRNPWRLAIDPVEELLYIPDVGQLGNDELDVVPLSAGGLNFGWPITEGTDCLADDPCVTSDFEMPVHEYGQSRSCALVGGPVYRGGAMPELHGTYFFGDYCVGWIRSLRYDSGQGVTDIEDREPDLGLFGNITSLSTDSNGEILITNLEGEVWRIDPVR